MELSDPVAMDYPLLKPGNFLLCNPLHPSVSPLRGF
jgi:hypothetical protein